VADKLQGTIKAVTTNQYGSAITLNEFEGWYNAGQYYQGPQLLDGLKGRRVEISYSLGKQPGRYFLNDLILLDGAAPAGPQPAPQPAQAPAPAQPVPPTTPQPSPSYVGMVEGAVANAVPDRDTLIVRQSSLRAAVEWLSSQPIAEPRSPTEVIELAEYWENWVLGNRAQEAGDQVVAQADSEFAPPGP
jgi:hypothetical protein